MAISAFFFFFCFTFYQITVNTNSKKSKQNIETFCFTDYTFLLKLDVTVLVSSSIIYINIHLRKLMDNTFLFLKKRL